MRDHIHDVLKFLAVARERSFTRAAAELGMSPSALSHSVRALETRLGVRLLTRTTRSVSATEAGERLLSSVAPRFAEIEAELAAVSDLAERVAGTIRIAALDHAVETLVWPRLAPVLVRHPQLKIEVRSEYRAIDIAAERYDIGILWGDQVHKDMIAVRLAPDQSMTVVGSPAYFATHGEPTTPQELARHTCIVQRTAGAGGPPAWELLQDGRRLKVRVSGQTSFSSPYPILRAATSGHGLACLPEDLTREPVSQGQLRVVLADHCPRVPGLHAYYTSRRHPPRALSVVLEALRTPAAGADLASDAPIA